MQAEYVTKDKLQTAVKQSLAILESNLNEFIELFQDSNSINSSRKPRMGYGFFYRGVLACL